jgi:hypothetical protein
MRCGVTGIAVGVDTAVPVAMDGFVGVMLLAVQAVAVSARMSVNMTTRRISILVEWSKV